MKPVPAPVCLCGAPLRRLYADAEGQYEIAYLLYRCETCDLISPDPLPNTDAVASQCDGYGDDAGPVHSAEDAARNRTMAERRLARIRAALESRAEGARCLEIGFATGAQLGSLAELGGLRVRGLAVDRKNPATVCHLAERVLAGMLEEEPATFDVVYAEQVIERVIRADHFLRQCHRVLRPGGLLMLGTPNFDGISARLMSLGWKEFMPREHMRMFTPRSLRYHLEQAGFANPRVTTQGLSFIRRRDRRDLVPLARSGLPMHVLVKAAGIVGMGDGLHALARKTEQT